MRYDHWKEPLPSRPEHDHAPDDEDAQTRPRQLAAGATALIAAALIVAIPAAVL